MSRRQALVAACVVLLAGATATLRLRRQFIAAFFGDAPPGAAPSLPRPGAPSDPVATVGRMRVVLLDGLAAGVARGLPTFNALCAEGLDLVVDVGFPSVSLPAQHVLWTGLLQQQSGVLYRREGLPAPPSGSLPARLPSRAVAESHAEISASFGFSEPPVAGASAEIFVAHAQEAVAGDRPLVFVHVLRIDDAGHRRGAASPEYREAAVWADGLLAGLLASDRGHGKGGTRWLVLSDHGHLERGGHGGEEDEVRLVRACVAGDLPFALLARREGRVHLVDLHRLLADSLGLEAAPGAAGRPLGAALSFPAPDVTLPRPGGLRWLLAIAIALIGCAIALKSDRQRSALPWWLPIAYVSVVLSRGWPSLSHSMIYPPQGRAMTTGALPGLVVLAVAAAWALRRRPLRAVVGSQLLPALAFAAAALVLCGGFEAPFGRPPLMPIWTAQASLLLQLCTSAMLVLSLVALSFALRPGFDPPGTAGASGTPAAAGPRDPDR